MIGYPHSEIFFCYQVRNIMQNTNNATPNYALTIAHSKF